MDVYIFSEHTLNAYGCIFSGCIFSVHTTEKKTEFCHRNLLKIVLQIVIQIFSYPFEQSGTDSWCRLRYAVCCARACVWESKRECVFRKNKSSYPQNRAAPTPGAAYDTPCVVRARVCGRVRESVYLEKKNQVTLQIELHRLLVPLAIRRGRCGAKVVPKVPVLVFHEKLTTPY